MSMAEAEIISDVDMHDTKHGELVDTVEGRVEARIASR